MTRYRWFTLSPAAPTTGPELARGLQKNQYEEARGWGFRLDSVDALAVTGVFVQRRSWDEPVIAPDGTVTVQPRLEYERTQFTADLEAGLIELVAPPRGLKPFLNQIAAALDFAVTVEAPVIDVLGFVRDLSSVAAVTMGRLSAVGVSVSPHATAAVEVSGTQGVREAFDSLIGERPASVDAVEVIALFGAESVGIRVARGGSATIRGTAGGVVLEMLRRYARKST